MAMDLAQLVLGLIGLILGSVIVYWIGKSISKYIGWEK